MDTVLWQLIQGHKELKFYKSGFLKLAIPFFGLSQPSPAKPDKKVRNMKNVSIDIYLLLISRSVCLSVCLSIYVSFCEQYNSRR